VHTYFSFAQDLSEIIKSDKRPGEDYLVIDVRDSDFVGGNITNCRRAPSATFVDNLDDLIRDTKDLPRVIFHCALSQSRWVSHDTHARCSMKLHRVLIVASVVN